nr:hypothetical protein CFP56_37860 [Quercus suber]
MEFQRGYSIYVVEALEHHLMLPKDMDALKNMRQHDLFMSLKRDLAMAVQEVFAVEEWVKDAWNEPSEAKGTKVALTIKDVVSKAMDAEPKSKAADLKFKAVDPKDDPS